MYAFIMQAADTGLTLKEVILNIPHDAGAAVVYVLMGLFVFFTWWGSQPDVIERYAAKRIDEDETESEVLQPDVHPVDVQTQTTAQPEDYSTINSRGAGLPPSGRVVVYATSDFADTGVAR